MAISSDNTPLTPAKAGTSLKNPKLEKLDLPREGGDHEAGFASRRPTNHRSQQYQIYPHPQAGRIKTSKFPPRLNNSRDTAPPIPQNSPEPGSWAGNSQTGTSFNALPRSGSAGVQNNARTLGSPPRSSISVVTAQTSASTRSGEPTNPAAPKRHISSSSAANTPTWLTSPRS